jgi:hypothetical protein
MMSGRILQMNPIVTNKKGRFAPFAHFPDYGTPRLGTRLCVAP